MELQDIINKIDIWQEWHDNYCYFVPKFIESAKTCESWQDWDKDLFYEFFERGGDQCVSSLKQGYFTNEEKAKIKEDWNELAPMLKAIAKSQDFPLWDVYKRIKTFIRQRTIQDRRTATNRLIASLQPNLLCTIVQERYLAETLNLMREAGLNIPGFSSNSWFESSFFLLDYFRSNIKCNSVYDICTYPWQVREFLRNTLEKQIQNMKSIQTYIDILKANKNLVLTGAPGTGKTFLAKEIAEAMDAEIEFVQFHPSYDYTDFVEGLRPVDDGGGHINFERKDGIFKKFCKKATYSISDLVLKSWNLLIKHLSQTDNSCEYNLPSNLLTYKLSLIKGENNRILIEEVMTVGGVLQILPMGNIGYEGVLNSYYCWLECGKVSDNPFEYSDSDNIGCKNVVLEILAKYYNLPLNNVVGNPFVFIIDEINRGELSKIFGELFFAIDPGYRGMKGKVKTQYQNLVDKNDEFADGFYVPENVYILATMNDIDRSVESLDFALRRRFAWKEIKPKDRLEMLTENLDKETCEKAVKVMTTLNMEISKTRGLGSAYQIGPAYFLRLDKEHYNGDFTALWDMHIEILLREYLRGYSNADAKIDEFKNLYFDALNETYVDAIE